MRRIGVDGRAHGQVVRRRGLAGQGPFQIGDRVHARVRRRAHRRRARRRPFSGHTGETTSDLVLHRVEDRRDGRADQDRVGQAERIGRRRAQLAGLDQPHRVVAQIAEQADRHRRQAGRQVHLRRRHQRAQRLRAACPRASSGTKASRIGARVAVDLGLEIAAAPDQVRLQADDRIAPAAFAALHAFEQEGVVAALGQLQDRPRPASPDRRSAAHRRPAACPPHRRGRNPQTPVRSPWRAHDPLPVTVSTIFWLTVHALALARGHARARWECPRRSDWRSGPRTGGIADRLPSSAADGRRR